MIRNLIDTRNFGYNTLQLIEYKSHSLSSVEYIFEYTDGIQKKIIPIIKLDTNKLKEFEYNPEFTVQEGNLANLSTIFDALCQYYELLDSKMNSTFRSNKKTLLDNEQVERVLEFIKNGQLYHSVPSFFGSTLYFYNNFYEDELRKEEILYLKDVKTGKKLLVLELMSWSSLPEMNLCVYSVDSIDSFAIDKPLFIVDKDLGTQNELREAIARVSRLNMNPGSILKNLFPDDFPFYSQYYYNARG